MSSAARSKQSSAGKQTVMFLGNTWSQQSPQDIPIQSATLQEDACDNNLPTDKSCRTVVEFPLPLTLDGVHEGMSQQKGELANTEPLCRRSQGCYPWALWLLPVGHSGQKRHPLKLLFQFLKASYEKMQYERKMAAQAPGGKHRHVS